MTGKQIIDLDSAESFNEGDLLLVRKSSMGVDRKISYNNFIESIGNPAINGYISALHEACENKIILLAANNAPVYKYYEGMKVSFTAPAKTTGIVQIRIGELEYKNLYRHKGDIAASLEQDDYIEAVLGDKGFYQVNDFKTIVKEQLIDLDSSDSLNQDDMLLIRKTGTDVNKKINLSNFIKTIGSSGVSGYVANFDVEQENKFTLKAANGTPVYKYYQSMKVSFKAPAKSADAPQVRIGELAYKNIYKYKSDIPISFEENDYIEAVFIGDNFYQINDLKTVTNIYTNDYICVAHETPKSGVSTDLTLVTAYGFHKREYYNGMSITFMCPINTKGSVRINIDGLGAKDIIEGDIEDFLYTPLYKGQIVHAIYNGVCFVKNKFQAENPKIRPSLEPCPTSSIEGKPQAVIPLENILEFNVGIGENCHFQTLRKALEEILNMYSDTSGRFVTLNILSNLSVTENMVIVRNRDLSWITIKGDAKNKITIWYDSKSREDLGAFFTLYSCKGFFNFAENTIITCDFSEAYQQFQFLHLNGGDLSLKDITLELMPVKIHSSYPSTNFDAIRIFAGNLTCDKVILSGFSHNIYSISHNSIISLTNCKFNNYRQYSIWLHGYNNKLTITNCDLSKEGVSAETDMFSNHNSTITQTNSKAKAQKLENFGYCAYLPNTTYCQSKYIVTGSQDVVGVTARFRKQAGSLSSTQTGSN
jgi:hypothetical protein